MTATISSCRGRRNCHPVANVYLLHAHLETGMADPPADVCRMCPFAGKPAFQCHSGCRCVPTRHKATICSRAWRTRQLFKSRSGGMGLLRPQPPFLHPPTTLLPSHLLSLAKAPPMPSHQVTRPPGPPSTGATFGSELELAVGLGLGLGLGRG